MTNNELKISNDEVRHLTINPTRNTVQKTINCESHRRVKTGHWLDSNVKRNNAELMSVRHCRCWLKILFGFAPDSNSHLVKRSAHELSKSRGFARDLECKPRGFLNLLNSPKKNRLKYYSRRAFIFQGEILTANTTLLINIPLLIFCYYYPRYVYHETKVKLLQKIKNSG
jgi:hypothetical protein